MLLATGLMREDNVKFTLDNWNQSGSVNIATELELDDRGSIPYRDRNFSLRHRIHFGSGTHLAF
jgi:hypothetical protein